MSDTVTTIADAPTEAGDVGGKRERSKAANRQAILDAARRVFSQLGYEAASVRDVIRGTDLASGTFYNYFKSKEELLEALQDDGARRFRPILRTAVEEARTFEDFVRGALQAYFRFVVEEHRLSGVAPIGHNAPFHADTPEMRAVYVEVRTAIQRMIGEGGGAFDVEYFAAGSIGLAREIGVQMLERDRPNPDEAAAFCAAILLSGAAALRREAGS